jgi:hypothetical protein
MLVLLCLTYLYLKRTIRESSRQPNAVGWNNLLGDVDTLIRAD